MDGVILEMGCTKQNLRVSGGRESSMWGVPKRTPGDKPPMGVSSVKELLQLGKIAIFKNVQVMKFFIVFYHAVKHFNCLFVDISLTYMIVVNNASIFSTLQFLI